MKQVKLLALTGVIVLLIIGVVVAPTAIVRAQTAAAEPELCTRLGSLAPSSNTVGCKYPDGALAFGTFVNGTYTQIAWFSPGHVGTVTDSKTGYQTTLSVSGGKTTVTIKDANGNVVATYVI